MVVLGIDPGTAIIGYAVIKKTPQGKSELITAGAIRPKASAKTRRAVEIHRAVDRILDIHRPDIVALEKIFFSKNIKTALYVAEARGILLLTPALRGLKVFEYTPLEVKLAVTGYGRADKNQVRMMVKQLLGAQKVPVLDDITDAMAIALCALHSARHIHPA